MRCDDWAALLNLYLDAELPEETARRLERHLLRCPHCAFEMRGLEQTRVMLQEAVPPAEVSPAFRERTAARLANAFADHLHAAHAQDSARQWSLPFPGDERM